MDTGVVTVLPTNNTGGLIALWGDARRVLAYLRRRIYGESGSIITRGEGAHMQLTSSPIYITRGGVRHSSMQASRNGGSDAI
jgi:hypothetical protein